MPADARPDEEITLLVFCFLFFVCEMGGSRCMGIGVGVVGF